MRRLPILRNSSNNIFPQGVVSVIIAVRNEAPNIVKCVQQFTNLQAVRQIIVVDDHSSDNTMNILTSLAGLNPKLTVLSSPLLPDGWTGKSHALYCGSHSVNTPYILFTDADVAIDEATMNAAVRQMEFSGLDHLSGHFKIECVSFGEKLCAPVMAVSSSISLFHASAGQGAGTGAFNLVKTDFYQRIGGHLPIKSAIVDDVSLAKLVRQKGGRSMFFDLSDGILVRLFSGISGFWAAVTRSSQAYLGSDLAIGILGGIGVFLAAIFTVVISDNYSYLPATVKSSG